MPDLSRIDLKYLLVLLDFFDALKICLVKEICDEEVATSLFKQYALDVWGFVGEHVTKLRANEAGWDTTGKGLEWLALCEPSDAKSQRTAPATDEMLDCGPWVVTPKDTPQ